MGVITITMDDEFRYVFVLFLFILVSLDIHVSSHALQNVITRSAKI